MIINHFKSSASIVTTIILAVLLVFANSFLPTPVADDTRWMPLAKIIIHALTGSESLNSISILLITLTLAFLSFLINDKLIILNQRSYFPFFITATILLSGSFMQQVHPSHFGLLFFFLAIFLIMSASESQNPAYNVINASLVLSAGSFIQFQLLFFLPLIWIAASLQRIFSLRMFLASLTGLLVPYLVVYGFVWVFGNLHSLTEPIVALFEFNFWKLQVVPQGFWVFFAGVSLLVFIGFISFLGYRTSLNSGSKKSMELFLAYIAMNLLFLAVGLIPVQSALIFGALPVGIFISGLWIRLRKRGQRWLFWIYLLLLASSFIPLL
jgi:hypothetical protein